MVPPSLSLSLSLSYEFTDRTDEMVFSFFGVDFVKWGDGKETKGT